MMREVLTWRSSYMEPTDMTEVLAGNTHDGIQVRLKKELRQPICKLVVAYDRTTGLTIRRHIMAHHQVNIEQAMHLLSFELLRQLRQHRAMRFF